MAKYKVSVESSKSVEEAFAYMADLRNFANWDPGVLTVTQVAGDGAGPESSFDVAVKSVGGGTVLRYETVEYDEPGNLLVEARNSKFTSIDRITVVAKDEGSIVTYSAELLLNGCLSPLNPLLGLVFNRIGDRAAVGLRRVLA
ncbi:MAG: SRPBCC family protein [Actinobacteria bacterium]|nr:SRPBCC family protein [Actinomycetota bacterium]